MRWRLVLISRPWMHPRCWQREEIFWLRRSRWRRAGPACRLWRIRHWRDRSIDGWKWERQSQRISMPRLQRFLPICTDSAWKRKYARAGPGERVWARADSRIAPGHMKTVARDRMGPRNRKAEGKHELGC